MKSQSGKMASVSLKSTSKYRIRSNSLPSRTHPTTSRVEEELQKIKSWEEATTSSSATAGDICYGLSSLQELHQSINDLLNMPLTIEALCPQLKEKWVDELLDKSVKILDICGDAKDMVSQCKENVRDLQSCLRRRRKGSDAMIETSIQKYFSCRRKMKKDAKRSLVSLKQIDKQMNASAPAMMDDHVSSIMRILQEANSSSISIFQAVLKFLSSKSYKLKTNKWDLVARFAQKERVGSEYQEKQSFLNEIQNADAALCSLCQNDEIEIGGVHIAQNMLQILEGSVEGLENQLDVMFRCLIRSRTTLLNVFTC